ncbi:MAG: pyridoxamine 5'-phosphate oxidase family protein [Leptospiraceae bacterium]|nr:pyridoxamine 5'-phosphate oxidase family protein [Leptospiraceae bacterium]
MSGAFELPGPITAFIAAHHVMALATTRNHRPYQCSVYYVPVPDEATLLFMSSEQTRHVQELRANPHVAGAIHVEPERVADIQGVQLTGTVVCLGQLTAMKNSDSNFHINSVFNIEVATNSEYYSEIDSAFEQRTFNETEALEKASLYLDRFPEGRRIGGSLFQLRLDWIKYTDNRIRFGFKQIWQREGT